MKVLPLTKQARALTLIEVLTLVAVLAMLVALALSALGRAKARSIRLCCINNLKQTGLAFAVWTGDNGNKYPMAVSETNGGSMEFTNGPNVFRHFQMMSNELSVPVVVWCPSEYDSRSHATNFTYLRNSNVSFFIGVDANPTIKTMILAGDHNLTNETIVKNGVLEFSTNHPSGWTTEMHNKVGNVVLTDMSVRQVDNFGVRDLVANTGLATNRLQMPVLSP